jgi:hypothetical protein
LVPGDNELGSLLLMEAKGPATTEISVALATREVKLTLYGFDGSSPNPALAAGLESLVTSVVLPMFLITPPTGPAYDNVASIKILPTTKDDGLVDITFKLNNPSKLGLTVYEFYDRSGLASTVVYMESQAYTLVPQPFTTPFHLNAGESNTITRQFKLILNVETGPLVEKGRAGSVQLGIETWSPTLRLDGVAQDFVPDWSVGSVHGGFSITLNTGPDFELLLDYKFPTVPLVERPPVTTPVVTTTEPVPTPTEIPPTPTTTEPTEQPTTTSVPAPETTTEPPTPESPVTPEPETPVTTQAPV